MRSTDAGVTWSAVTSATQDQWGVWGEGSKVVTMGELGTVLRSTDGGGNWHELHSGVHHLMRGVLEPVGSRATPAREFDQARWCAEPDSAGVGANHEREISWQAWQPTLGRLAEWWWRSPSG